MNAPFSAPTVINKTKTKYIVMGAILMVSVLGGVAFIKNKKAEVGQVVTVEKATVKTITQLVTATGKIQPETEVKISPEVAGEIIAIPVIEGQTIKKGTLLVRIKPDTYQAQLEQQEASLASAKATAVLGKAQFVKANQDFTQSEELHKKNLISEADYNATKTLLEVAQANVENYQAQIRRNEASLSQARDQLNKTTIYAPMDGSISSLTSEVGERVVAQSSFTGTEIMRVADLTNMEVRVKVNENDIVNVKLGDKTVISIDAFPGRKFAGIVYEISSSAQGAGGSGAGSNQALNTDEVTNFLVKIRIADRDIKLRPGMSATVDIETQTVDNVISVPVQSVTVRAAGGKTSEDLQKEKAKETRDKSGNDLDVANEREEARRNKVKLDRVVFVKKGDIVELRKVETGIADNTSIEIKSGVKSGEDVVSGSYAAISRKLKDGAKVQLEKLKIEEDKK
ncbi:MAG: efflux RND transporter periplasmic adaptor subunit [Opitutaceae bacterium]|jgi:HlyD family secretion protein